MLQTEVLQETLPQAGVGIRFESIGGLGANLAGKILAEAGVLHMGFNGAQFSTYGSEKKGSPVTTYIRFMPSDKTIRITEPIDTPDVIVVFHEALLKSGTCIEGLKPGGTLIVNTSKTPQEIQTLTGLSALTIVCVDAQQISIEEHTRINTAMLGALSGAVGYLSAEAVKQGVEDALGRKYKDLVAANVRTFDRGCTEIRAKSFEESPDVSMKSQATVKRVQSALAGGVINQAGNSILKDLSASRQGFLPGLKLESCINCAACDQVCPDFCFVWEARTDAKGRTFQYLTGIDYQYCKGCLKCVDACPTDALSKEREADDFAALHRVAHAWI